ncbi:MAG: hypothetical protein EZS28_046807 [Streblomastix strix]|uniref:Uncharacterized protein n=1 Tax=Streblomastix strix TaxID=222440 RepID=A0A5J4TGM0_9EUKA|nr:MAG: hypothetical protein EZS28_046807 [Streblomastix strix]
MVALNNSVSLMNQQPEQILTTDASEALYGATLEVLKFKRRQNCQKPRPLIGIQPRLIKGRQLLYNSTAVYKSSPEVSAPVLVSLDNKIMVKQEFREMKFTAFHIPGKSNQVADVLSRLSTSGDYQIRQEVLEKALRETLKVPEDNQRQIGYGIRWIRTQLEKHDSPLISTNQSNSNSIEQNNYRSSSSSTHSSELGSAALVAVIPMRGCQSNSGRKCNDVLVAGGCMKNQKLHLPPTDLLVAKIKGIKVIKSP